MFDLDGLKIPVTKHIRVQQMFQIVLLESLSDFTRRETICNNSVVPNSSRQVNKSGIRE